jgi:hypothetical protein
MQSANALMFVFFFAMIVRLAFAKVSKNETTQKWSSTLLTFHSESRVIAKVERMRHGIQSILVQRIKRSSPKNETQRRRRIVSGVKMSKMNFAMLNPGTEKSLKSPSTIAASTSTDDDMSAHFRTCRAD